MADSEALTKICDIGDVAEDDPYVGKVDDTDIAVFQVDDEYYAINNTCPHQGGPLNKGKVEDECVYCPWHGWQFDLNTGEHVQKKKDATTYDVTVEDGAVLVEV